jgi:hypothetical protein
MRLADRHQGQRCAKEQAGHEAESGASTADVGFPSAALPLAPAKSTRPSAPRPESSLARSQCGHRTAAVVSGPTAAWLGRDWDPPSHLHRTGNGVQAQNGGRVAIRGRLDRRELRATSEPSSAYARLLLWRACTGAHFRDADRQSAKLNATHPAIARRPRCFGAAADGSGGSGVLPEPLPG